MTTATAKSWTEWDASYEPNAPRCMTCTHCGYDEGIDRAFCDLDGSEISRPCNTICDLWEWDL